MRPTPPGFQTDLLKCSRETRRWLLEAATESDRLQARVKELEGEEFRRHAMDAIVATEQRCRELEAENARLQDYKASREEKDAAFDIDIERIIANLPPLKPGKASKAISAMRTALGMESGPISEVVIRGAEEINHLRRRVNHLEREAGFLQTVWPCGTCEGPDCEGCSKGR